MDLYVSNKVKYFRYFHCVLVLTQQLPSSGMQTSLLAYALLHFSFEASGTIPMKKETEIHVYALGFLTGSLSSPDDLNAPWWQEVSHLLSVNYYLWEVSYGKHGSNT